MMSRQTTNPTITSIQKVIKVGSSLAVTIPAKDAKHYGIEAGDDLEMTLRRPTTKVSEAHSAEVVDLTQKLIARHRQALKNLSQR